jgi:division protein CdvB (Snf7/Vps24/ESCRT-III family)
MSVLHALSFSLSFFSGDHLILRQMMEDAMDDAMAEEEDEEEEERILAAVMDEIGINLDQSVFV